MLTASRSKPLGNGYRLQAAVVTILLLLPALALAVAVDIGDGAGTVGDIITVPITVDDVTGLDIYSYELRITWYANRATATGAPTAGTLTEAWGAVTVNSDDGEVVIVAAGSVPLAGSGTLLNLTFELGPNSGNTTLYLEEAIFNEGDPPAETSNGSIQASALPTITITPNSGEVVVGETLVFATSGGTPPYTYSTTNPAVADFAGDDELTGLTPGTVQARSEDFNGIIDYTNDFIHVRAIGLMAGGGAGMPGDIITIPMTITDPVAYDIVAAEFEVGYNDAHLVCLGTATEGTLVEAAGWSIPVAGISAGNVTVSLAGSNELSGPGVLIYLVFQVESETHTHIETLNVHDGMFNEIYPPKHVNGSIQITDFATLYINPDTAEMVVGDTQQFSVVGGSAPYDWQVTDPLVAEIDADGLLTALAPGVTQVYVEDVNGASDYSSTVTVCDFYVVAPVFNLPMDASTLVPISIDRDIDGLDIWGFELTLTFNPTYLEVLDVTTVGAITEGWGAPVTNLSAGQVIIVHAGALPLSGTAPLLFLEMQGTEELWDHTTALNIEWAYFNEGNPCAEVIHGSISVPTAVPDLPANLPRLQQNYPNPFNPQTMIEYYLPEPGMAALRVFSAAGQLVCTLADRYHPTGDCYRVSWNGSDDAGNRLASGMYYYHLETEQQSISRKMVLLK